MPIDCFQQLLQSDWQFTCILNLFSLHIISTIFIYLLGCLISSTLISLQRVRSVLYSEALQPHSLKIKNRFTTSKFCARDTQSPSVNNKKEKVCENKNS